jgi:predicted nucleic acid-binding protein
MKYLLDVNVLTVDSLSAWCQSPSRTTDAHLVQLAQKHGFTLATLDSQIPEAFLIPFPPRAVD